MQYSSSCLGERKKENVYDFNTQHHLTKRNAIAQAMIYLEELGVEFVSNVSVIFRKCLLDKWNLGLIASNFFFSF